MVMTEIAREECESLIAIYGEEHLWVNMDENILEAIIDLRTQSLQLLENYILDSQYSPWENLKNDPIYPIVMIRLQFSQTYPNDGIAPKLDVFSNGMDSEDIDTLRFDANIIYTENPNCLFKMIEMIRESYVEMSPYGPPDDCSYGSPDDCKETIEGQEILESHVNGNLKIDIIGLPEITHGEFIIDRKSIFQAHVARAYSLKEVQQVYDYLLSIPRISRATHNILAYKIHKNPPKSNIGATHKKIVYTDKELTISDHNSDGETAAGGRLQFLLSHLALNDVVVVVTRWYGGKKLGPDRFKHINNAAKSTLIQAGFISH